LRRLSAHILFLFLVSLPLEAEARRYPITRSDASGTWVGGPEGLLHGVGELWTRYGKSRGLAADRINDIELSTRSVWVATPAGLSRLDKGTRRWETFTTPDLSVAHVTGVSMDTSDPDQLWVSTLGGGLANLDIRQNRWTRHGKARGLPSERVNDVLFRGRTVFAATDAGLAVLDTARGTVKVYTERDGMAPGAVRELEVVGADLWITSGGGLSRMNLQRRTFAAFGKAQGLPGAKIISLARAAKITYLVTNAGVILYDSLADALSPFLHLKGLQGAAVRGVASAGGFVWFATDNGLARFEPTRKTWEYYRLEDGASSDDLDRITFSGSDLLIFHTGGELDTYAFKKDEWIDRSGLLAGEESPAVDQPGEGGEDPAGTEAEGGAAPGAGSGEKEGSPVTFSAELDTEFNLDLGWKEGKEGWEHSREGIWKMNKIRLGAGTSWAGGSSLDVSALLDWGDIYAALDPEGKGITGDDDGVQRDARIGALTSFQQYDVQLRYLGGRGDTLREVLLSDEVRVAPRGGTLTERTEVEGGRVVLDLVPEEKKKGAQVELSATAGLRRGTPARKVISRPSVKDLETMSFELDRQFVIPSSVRATLDGYELERNVDYFVDHSSGVLWITNTDRVHPMVVLEVDFEYEQIPRKNVGVVTVTDQVPKDLEIGQLKRSGASRWAKDEQGLFDEIDGGAEQYINRGWVQTLSQDFTWGSAGATLRIHDMGSEENARSILLARLAGDAKPLPIGADGTAYLEKQSASVMVKMISGTYFIEITLDDPNMEQGITAITTWLWRKGEAAGGTSADDLRDLVLATGVLVRLGESTSVGANLIGSQAMVNSDLPEASRIQRNILSMHAAHVAKITGDVALTTRIQAATSSAERDSSGSFRGQAIRADALLTAPWLELSVDGRVYSSGYSGIGTSRQTEFCRAKDGACDRVGESQLDHEVSVRGTVQPLEWLPLDLAYQRQQTSLGSDYSDAPADRARLGIRDVATGRLSLARKGIPRASIFGGYIRRDDALSEQDQLRVGGSVEADLAQGLLSKLEFKKIYLRGLYEYGHGAVDEFRKTGVTEKDRTEGMHHAVVEARLAPTLTESGYAKLTYHGLLGTLDTGGDPVDRLTYWRLDGGASSSWVPGLAARMETTLWFKDAMPFVDPYANQGTLASAAVVQERGQVADSLISGILDLFPGEWLSALSRFKVNVAYTYSEQGASQGKPRRGSTTSATGKEQCDVAGDEDLDGLSDCADPDCALTDACLVTTKERRTHRVYGTLSWDTPGKVQMELFGDFREVSSGQDDTRRQSRQEVRTFVTWRPIYPSPITLRFDMVRDWILPEKYDGLSPELDFITTSYSTALEWRRRWSTVWWHLAKLTFNYNTVRDQPHIRTVEDRWGKKGDLERLSHNSQTLTPSVEVRRRFEDSDGRWSVRPYARLSGTFTWGQGVSSRIDNRECKAEDDCLADGSSEGQGAALTLGFIWVHSDKLFLDLDLTGSYTHCSRAPNTTLKVCGDSVKLTPKLLATVRY